MKEGWRGCGREASEIGEGTIGWGRSLTEGQKIWVKWFTHISAEGRAKKTMSQNTNAKLQRRCAFEKFRVMNLLRRCATIPFRRLYRVVMRFSSHSILVIKFEYGTSRKCPGSLVNSVNIAAITSVNPHCKFFFVPLTRVVESSKLIFIKNFKNRLCTDLRYEKYS